MTTDLRTSTITLSTPPSPPDHIVCLEECHCSIPSFSIPHTYTGYSNTAHIHDEISSRVKDATIIITTRVPITRAILSQCSPKLRMIAIMAAGYDGFDIEACRERGITVCNIPHASSESVAEHAIALVMAVKRRVVELDAVTKRGEEWPTKRTTIHRFGGLPTTWKKDVMGIIGYGTLGKRIGDIAKALGMTVLQAERKGSASVRAGRTDFQEMLQRSSIVVLCCPLDDSTRGMIGESELRAMGNDAILVNVSRGGVVDEVPLATALKKGWIKGAATDVFEIEPASASSPLLAEGIPNLTLSPHVAWYAEASIENLQATVKSNVENFVAGKPDNVL